MARNVALLWAAVFALTVSASAAKPDAFALWKQGAFRGANVMQYATTDDMRVLRSWGANLAEIPITNIYDPRPPYSFRPEELDRTDRLVESAETAGLFVVLTCREGPGRENFETSLEIWRDAAAQEAYARMWQRVAAHYRGRASVVGFDLVCEPHPDEAAKEPLGDWNALAKKITKAIRSVNKETPILVNSSGWGYPHLFDELQPTGDPRTVYVVHFYSPRHYTHQRPNHPVAYPGVVPAHVEPEQRWDRETVKRTLLPVRKFQEKHHVPILAGEFGCARWAPNVEQFLRDQMDLYEQWGWSWAYYAFREWDAMDIEKTADAKDKTRHADTPLLRLFKSYYAKDRVFSQPPRAKGGLPPL